MKPSRFCRVCATKVNEACEIENNPAKPELPLLLKRYVPEFDIEVENACLCYDCVNTLYKIHNFKKKCLQTEEDVRLHIRQHPDVKTVNLKDIFSSSGQTNNVALETTNQTINNETIESSSKSCNNPPVVTAQYLCTLCCRRYTCKKSLVDHKRKFHLRKRYQCGQCSRDFMIKTKYETHLAYHKTPNAGRYICETCNFVYATVAVLNKHTIRKHLSDDHKQFGCEVCRKRFSKKSILRVHMQTHAGEKPHKCSACTYGSTRKSLLRKHVERKHSNIQVNRKVGSRKVYEQSSNVTLETANQTINNQPIESSSKNCNNPPVVTTQYKCKLCYRYYASKDSLEVHKRKFHSGERYQCDQCSRNFVLKNLYETHLAYHKTPNAGRYMCETCNFVFTSVAALKHHNMHKHVSDDQKPFACEVCGKRFTSRRNLSVHMRTHTGEKPFKCSWCEHASITKMLLHRHVVTMHKNVVIKRYISKAKTIVS